MSVESGKLKSPLMNVVHTRCGGKCLLMAPSAVSTRRGGHCGGRWRLTIAYMLVVVTM